MEYFTHEVKVSCYSGSHFEIGQQLGEKVREKSGPKYIDNVLKATKDSMLYKALGLAFDLSSNRVNKVFPIVEQLIKKVHPGLIEEMQGFAQGLGEDYRRLLVFINNFGHASGCSQFFVNGFHARNYDDTPGAVENEFLLTSPKGSYTSFGSSTQYIQRLDGMNEHGLAVSLTFGAGYPAKDLGIGAAMFQRIALDKSKTVEEVLALLKRISYVSPNNVLISDASGRAVVVEGSVGKFRVRQDQNDDIFCANSYLDLEMKDQQRLKNPTTVWRENLMKATLLHLTNEESIMDLLTSDYPKGLYEPYFSEGLGTLWSVVYHPSSRKIYLAIGEKGKSRQEVRFNLTDLSTLANLPVSLKTELKETDLGERILQYRSMD